MVRAPLRAALFALPLASCLAFSASVFAAEPWSDADPAKEPTRHVFGDIGIRAGAEYRAQWMTVDPIALSSETGRRISWLEHRLRLDAKVDFEEKARLVMSFDVLDGVLWGDNGAIGSAATPNAGTNVGARNPNVTRPCVASTGGDLLDFDAYAYTLCEAEPFKVRHLYGDVVLPIGLLRIGRQAANIGTGVQAADGEGRANRFGIARTGNVIDRIVFGTKPLEAFKPKAERDVSPNKGLIVAFAYDRLVTDDLHIFGDDVQQLDAAVRFLAPKHPWGQDALVAAYFVHRWDADNVTRVNSLGTRMMSRFGSIYAGFDVAANLGSTREIAEAYRLITSDPPTDQTVKQIGSRVALRWDAIPRGNDWDKSWLSLYIEGDYASGDEDPNVRTPLTQFVFSEDANVGLLMFEHVLAFQSARAAAAGVETLRRLGATSFPAEAVNTRGSFTNAIAIFPQVDVRPTPDLLLRGGVLAAWGAERVVDPVASLQARDGLSIEDDLVNFVGGKPARFYGVEIDGRVQYRLYDHFVADLEGALYFPGDAMKDADGNAVRSGLVQGRGTFYF